VGGTRAENCRAGKRQARGHRADLAENPPILLLTRRTVRWTAKTEHEIQDALAFRRARAARCLTNRTTVWSTVAEADRIVVLEQGRWLNRAPMDGSFGTERALLAQAVSLFYGTASNRKRIAASRHRLGQGLFLCDRFVGQFVSTPPVILVR